LNGTYNDQCLTSDNWGGLSQLELFLVAIESQMKIGRRGDSI